MATLPLSNTFEGGTDGTLISVGNSGGLSGDAFSSVTGTLPKFTNVQAVHGPLAMRVVDATTNQQVIWSGLGSVTAPVFVRFYAFYAAAPTTQHSWVFRARDNADAAAGWLNFGNDGLFHGADASINIYNGPAYSVNKWIRGEAKFTPGTGTSGALEYRLFNSPEAISPSGGNTIPSINMGANISAVQFGPVDLFPTTPFTVYLDDIAVSTADWIGPSDYRSRSTFTAIPFQGPGRNL